MKRKKIVMRPETLARRSRERAASRAAQHAALLVRLEEAARKHGPDSIYPEMLAEARRRGNPAGQLWYPGGVAVGVAHGHYLAIPIESTVGWDFVTLRGMFPASFNPERIGVFEARLGYEHSGQHGYRLFKLRVNGKWSRPLPLRAPLATLPGVV